MLNDCSLFFPGPGLAIRVICAEEPFMCKDFPETAVLLKFITDFAQASKTVSTIYYLNTFIQYDLLPIRKVVKTSNQILTVLIFCIITISQ